MLHRRGVYDSLHHDLQHVHAKGATRILRGAVLSVQKGIRGLLNRHCAHLTACHSQVELAVASVLPLLLRSVDLCFQSAVYGSLVVYAGA